MIQFTLKILFKIIGLGSASGLVYTDNSLLIVGDNSGYLYEYSIVQFKLKRHQLIKNPKENIPKKDKIDFEAIANYGDSLYVFGSGSGKKRNEMIAINTKDKDAEPKTDLTHLYLAMQKVGKIKPSEFNIEGAIYNGENWFLFNRGKGASNRNVIFTITGKSLYGELNILSNDVKLPKINGFRTGFSDAILVGDKIYFLATAENSTAADAEGRILGTIVGRIDLATLKLDFTQKISNTQKFEGITLLSNSNEKIEFLLCEDNDTEVLKSNIYKLALTK